MSFILCDVLSYGLYPPPVNWGNPWQDELAKEMARQHFVEAALKGGHSVFDEYEDASEVNLWLSIIDNNQIVLSKNEIWIRKAVQNNSDFSKKKFTELNYVFQRQIYFVANAFGSEAVVRRLKPLMPVEPLIFSTADNLLAINMDVITVRNTMQRLLYELRKSGALLTKKEFKSLSRKDYLCKGDDFGRVLGKNLIERVAVENGLTRIKVPKKIVVTENAAPITFIIDHYGKLKPEASVAVYAKKIKPVQRKLPLYEAIELMKALIKTGFGDLLGPNCFITKDGIHFIDTEFGTFDPRSPQFNVIECISDLVTPKDKDKFLGEFRRQKKAFERMEKMREKQKKECDKTQNDPYANFLKHYKKRKFTFPFPNVS